MLSAAMETVVTMDIVVLDVVAEADVEIELLFEELDFLPRDEDDDRRCCRCCCC